MGTATRKAAKAVQLRVNLTSLVLAGGLEAQGARRAKKVLAGSWNNRHGNTPGNFHVPDGRQVITAKATRPYRVV